MDKLGEFLAKQRETPMKLIEIQNLEDIIKKDTLENNYNEDKSKTIAYDYMFNYFGKDTFKDKIITGANIQIAIKAYKNGTEIKFKEEPKAKDYFYCDNFKVSFDIDKLYNIKKDIFVDNLYRTIYDWDKIDYEVIGFTLNYLDQSPDNSYEMLPVELKNCPYSIPIEVSKEEFEGFLKKHIKDFDIRDNINAQVPSMSFI